MRSRTVVKDLMAFRGTKGFDIEKYNQFTQTVLPAMGFGEAQIEELAADQLILGEIENARRLRARTCRRRR